MNINKIPTSSDIYIEVNGKKIAVVQSYSAKTSCSSKHIEAFGESEPIASVGNKKNHSITISRLYATDEALKDGISFHDIPEFSLVIVRPDKRVIYSGCRIDSISEKCDLNDAVLESVSIIASKRIEQ